MSSVASETKAQGNVVLRQNTCGITTLTLNKPKQLNALSEEMLSALQHELDLIADDDSVRVVIIAANGKAFCAGHDLKQMRANPRRDYYQALFAQCSKVMQTILTLPQPVIAKVQGIATAAGCQLVATCDLAIAAKEARFAVSGINVGLFCGTPAVALSRNISRKQAFEMLLTGDFIDADTAVGYGLINRAVPASELDETVKSLCDKICAKSRVSVSTGKDMFYAQLEKGLAAAYAYAQQIMVCNMMADDAGEGIDAFLQRRQPVWKDK